MTIFSPPPPRNPLPPIPTNLTNLLVIHGSCSGVHVHSSLPRGLKHPFKPSTPSACSLPVPGVIVRRSCACLGAVPARSCVGCLWRAWQLMPGRKKAPPSAMPSGAVMGRWVYLLVFLIDDVSCNLPGVVNPVFKLLLFRGCDHPWHGYFVFAGKCGVNCFG